MTQAGLGAGLGLKPPHFAGAAHDRRPGQWFEIHPENYMSDGGPRLRGLEQVRAAHPLSLHGVGLSLGGPDPLDRAHLARFRDLIGRFEPSLVSEHLAWSRFNGLNVPDLLPILRTRCELTRIAGRIDAAQTALGRRLLIENPSHYLDLSGHDYEEADFLSELVARTGCGLLVDLNNLVVSARNIGVDPEHWLRAVPAAAVGEIHIAGHSEDPLERNNFTGIIPLQAAIEAAATVAQPPPGEGLKSPDQYVSTKKHTDLKGAALLIDSHDRPVSEAVWGLLETALRLWGPRPVLIERDADVPDYAVLIDERERAQTLIEASDTVRAA